MASMTFSSLGNVFQFFFSSFISFVIQEVIHATTAILRMQAATGIPSGLDGGTESDAATAEVTEKMSETKIET